MKRLAALAVITLGVLCVLCGCTKTVTVTYKYRSLFGWYYVCTGPKVLPCGKGTIWRVTQQEYSRARVGHSYTLRLP